MQFYLSLRAEILNINLLYRTSVLQQFCVQNIKIPHFLCAFAEVETSTPAWRDIEKSKSWYSILPQSLLSCSVCVCVWVLGLMGGVLQCGGQINNGDEVTYWSLFKHWPEPLTSSLKHISTPEPMDQLQLLAHTTAHLAHSLLIISMIWHYVFSDLTKPLSPGASVLCVCVSGSVTNYPICSERTLHYRSLAWCVPKCC